MNPMSSLTCQLLKVIGSPYANTTPDLDTQHLLKLYNYAVKNRIPLLYLKSLRKYDKLGALQKEYNELIDKYANVQEAFYKVSCILDKADVNYTFFKSIRPYQEVTVDIDILIFGPKYKEVIRVLRSANYTFLGRGPLSTTFRDSDARINLDIYNDVGVSNIIYLDKDKLGQFVGDRNLSNSLIARSLDPEADLLAVIAHSVIKEHMYVLSEYYTTLHYLEAMTHKALCSFVSLADKCRMRLAVKTHLGITALLHYCAHSIVPECIVELIKILDANHLELSLVAKMGFYMPHKYHPITITKALIDKFGEKKARVSFGLQTLNMLNPKFTSSFVKMALHNIFRETY